VTAKANEAFAAGRDLSDPASFADAKRGFIAAPTGQVRDGAGKVIWDFDGYAFVRVRHRPRSTRACGARPCSTTRPACSRWPRAFTSCAVSTWPTSR
jgi:alkyl sulfatase BDS1-like metallo-beta-lactamase superfamily hydrolase